MIPDQNLDLIGSPHDLAAERCVIGSMLLSPEACDTVSLILREDDFYDQRYAILFRHMLSIHERGQPLDETLLVRQMKKSGDLKVTEEGEQPVSMIDMAEAIYSVPTAANASYYANIVRETAIQRGLLRAAERIAREAHQFDGDVNDLLAMAERDILAVGERRMRDTALSISNVIQEAFVEIDKRMKSQTPAGLQTGLWNLDAVIGGLREGEMIILAARPSMGKTALAISIADHLAVKSAAPVLFFSLEMGRMALAERLLCSRAGVSLSGLRHGSLSETDCQTLVRVSADVSQGELHIDDAGGQSIGSIGATARRMKRRHGLALVIIDYLQLIVPDGYRENREQQVATMSRRLKHLARELSIPVLCLAQLNREVEKRPDKRPHLADLRESGAIEQDADIVLFVHREHYFNPTAQADKAEVLIRKNRNGPTGNALVKWESQYTRFSNPVEQWEVPDDF